MTDRSTPKKSPESSLRISEEMQAYNNRFFDSSMLTGWLRCEIGETFPIRYINEYYATLLGYESREALMEDCGGSYAALMARSEDAAALLAAVCALPEDGNAAFTYRMRTKGGGEMWIREHSHRYLDADGTPMLLCLCINITDIVRMESRIQEQAQALEITSGRLEKERLYQRMLNESIPVGTVILRLRDGALLHAGGTMLEELGYTRAEFEAFQAAHLKGFVYDGDYGTAFQDMRPGMEALAPAFEQEYRVVKKDGSLVWLYEKGMLAQLEDGEPAYIFVYMNISRRKAMEERLRISEEEMKIAMAQMGKMVCLYDPATRTLTMPAGYAAQYGVPLSLPDVPDSVLARGIVDAENRAAYAAMYEAILRGDRTGASEARLRGADGVWHWEHAEFVTVFGSDGRPYKTIIALEDTTRRHLEEDRNEQLRESERMFRVVASHSNRLIYRYDIESRTTYMDVDGKETIVDENVPESLIESGRVLPESVDDVLKVFHDIRAGKPEGSAKLHLRNQDGGSHWADMRYSLIHAGGKRPKSAVLSFLDVTEAHEKELAFERYQQTIEQDTAAGAGLIFLEADVTADVMEKQGGDMLPAGFPSVGMSRTAAIRFICENFIVPEDRERCLTFFSRENLVTLFSDGVRNLSETWRITYPGRDECWMRSELQMVQDPYSGHIKVYSILRDVTEDMLAALSVKKQAETDGMTGLYNKATTEDMIRKRLAVGNGEACALLIADLDSLKRINDDLGHAQGDRALKLTAETLRSQFRQTDIVGRIGGDEFMAFLAGAGSEAQLRGTMEALMRRFSVLRIGEADDVPMHASMGLAFGTTGKDSFETLYRHADRALYHVKKNGKNDYAFYTPDMEREAYQYTGHNGGTSLKAEVFDRSELERLLDAICAIYPLVISANLTRNSYYMMKYDDYATKACFRAGAFDELIETGAATFRPEDRDAFVEAFSRENLLKAHARGEKRVSHTGMQLGDDGVYRRIRTDVIFVRDEKSGDVMEISFGRELGPEGETADI